MSKKKHSEKQLGAILVLAFATFLLGIIIGYLYWGYNSTEYDQDCLDELANEICKQNGYGYGEDTKASDDVFKCYLNERLKHFRYAGLMEYSWLEGEKESCIIK